MEEIEFDSDEQKKSVDYVCDKIKAHKAVPKIWKADGKIFIEVEDTDETVKPNPFVVTKDGTISKLRKLAGRPTVHRDSPKTSKNSPCHCGSGKKFRKCHGKKKEG
jgi:hypothetical protein